MRKGILVRVESISGRILRVSKKQSQTSIVTGQTERCGALLRYCEVCRWREGKGTSRRQPLWVGGAGLHRHFNGLLPYYHASPPLNPPIP